MSKQSTKVSLVCPNPDHARCEADRLLNQDAATGNAILKRHVSTSSLGNLSATRMLNVEEFAVRGLPEPFLIDGTGCDSAQTTRSVNPIVPMLDQAHAASGEVTDAFIGHARRVVVRVGDWAETNGDAGDTGGGAGDLLEQSEVARLDDVVVHGEGAEVVHDLNLVRLELKEFVGLLGHPVYVLAISL